MFFSHALILILHFLSLTPLQSTSVGDDGGGADGGSGSHLSQVFLHFFFIEGTLHFFFLHFLEVSTHGGDGVGGGGEGLGVGGDGTGGGGGGGGGGVGGEGGGDRKHFPQVNSHSSL